MNASQRQRRQFFEISLQSSGCSQTARDRIDANQKINKQAISRFFVISGGRGSPIPQERYLLRMECQQGICPDLESLRESRPPSRQLAAQNVSEHLFS
jgi:hypothetical protein